MVPDAKVAIVPGRSSGVRFSVIIRALKQYVELQQQYPQPPQPQPYGYNQQPQSPPQGVGKVRGAVGWRHFSWSAAV